MLTMQYSLPTILCLHSYVLKYRTLETEITLFHFCITAKDYQNIIAHKLASRKLELKIKINHMRTYYKCEG